MRLRSWTFLGLSLIGPIVLLWAVHTAGIEEAGFPKRTELTCFEARVLNAQPGEYGASIQLEGSATRLFYSRKSGEFDAIVDVLGSRTSQPLTLCYRTEDLVKPRIPHEPNVFEMRSKSEAIRSLEQVRVSWADDRKWLFFLIPLVLLASTYLAFLAGRYR